MIADLAVLFIGAKLAGVAFARLGQPPVIGELLAGLLLGPHVLGAVSHIDDVHLVFQEVGAIVLLFAVGLDTPLSDLAAVGGRSFAVGVSGIVVPFLLGAGLLWLLGEGGRESLFIGTALVATSVGITARVLGDLDKIRTKEARVILGAAVVDDVLGLLLLAIVTGTVSDNLSISAVVILGVLAVAFVALVAGLGSKLVVRVTPGLDRLGEQGVFMVALGICLALAAVAGALRLAAIIGAFLAGMAFAETRDRYRLEEHLASVYSFLVPFFFAVTGALVDPAALTDGRIAFLSVVVTITAIGGKLVGCGLPALPMGRRSAAIVGVGMVPRGEVGILVATIGLGQGVIGGDLYAVVVTMSVATTLLAPPVLAGLFHARRRRRRGPYREIHGIGG